MYVPSWLTLDLIQTFSGIASLFFTGIIFVGLIFEYSGSEPAKRINWTPWDGPLKYWDKERIGEILVVLGVVGEFVFGCVALGSTVMLDTAQKREILALDKEIAPRRLTADQSQLITSAAFSSADLIGVSSYALDPESAILCEQILKSLAVRWPKPIDGCMSQVVFGSIDLGIQITGSDSELKDALAKTLRSFGLAVATDIPPRPSPAPRPDVNIFVGIKPLTR
jgi:hypothetical protein